MQTVSKAKLEEEIVNLLKWLGKYGLDTKGGTSRLLYTSEWINAQKALEQLFKSTGLNAQYDNIGNLFGKLEGSLHKDETILTGSHIDTVKNGGLYDGQYGIIAGLLAIKYLKDTYGQPLRNVEVVSMAEEEGSRFPYTFWGSKNIVGETTLADVQDIYDTDGISLLDAMHQAGFEYSPHSDLRVDYKAFVELHTEQGGVLEIEKKSIGIVHHIVGQKRFTIEVIGEANHAGTTPMKYRRDAVTAMNSMIYTLQEMTKAYGEPIVATIGKIEVEPNIANVVPGKARFTLDIRHTDKRTLQQFTNDITQRINTIANDLGLELRIDEWMDNDPVQMNAQMVELMQKQCETKNIPYKLMHSGAGHDAQIFAPHIPTAMLFVPSHKGISHSPLEYTDPTALAEGVDVLISTLYELAYRKEWLFKKL